MEMLDNPIKFVALIAGIIGIGKIYYEILMGKHTRMRDEYKFAKEFFGDMEANQKLHPFVAEKGYQAISGNKSITLSEMEYLMSLQEPDLALRDYVLGIKYLKHVQAEGNRQIIYNQKRYQKVWYRWILKTLYIVFYFALAFLAMAPLLFPKLLFKDPAKISLGAIVMWVSVSGLYTWASIHALARVVRAEKLVLRQRKYSTENSFG